MNRITLNGHHSSDVDGLLISSLPPISKPLIRTKVETIDGRDGDIVTKLGYSAYDKTVQIGLKGSYNVDDVIAFFDSEGEVIFSNEADKFYRYQIIEQIDFEKLIRFKTAKVVFHCQPFKYSAIEEEKTFDIADQTSVSVFNRGNTESKPKITLYGSGALTLKINGTDALEVTIDAGYITIDVNEMQAYKGNTFLNRKVTGDYSDCKLKVGTNVISVISWTGSVTKVIVDNYTRWI